MAAAGLTPGKLIAERYQLEKLLGEGGMGAVWLAMHVVTKKRIALKFLKASAAQNPQHVRRFLREARAASAVQHPNVVEIHDIVEDDGSPVMVMDYLVGESLAERLERQKVVPLPELVSLLLPAISAVGTAHSVGIVHRDLKPDNVFLEQAMDGRIVPRILDFGIAKLNALEGAAAETSTLTRTGSVMGTPYYMAPEQVFGERDIDQRADVWAFGVILYEALSGKRPVEGDNFGQLFKIIATGDIVPLAQLVPQLPTDVTTLVDRMLSKERHKRPHDLREVFQVLSPYGQVRASPFQAPRLDLEAQRESSVAYAPTQTPGPAPPTPLQFADAKGKTALLTETPREAAPTSEAFARSGIGLPSRSSNKKWLLVGAAVLVGGGGIVMSRESSHSATNNAGAAAPSTVPGVRAERPTAPAITQSLEATTAFSAATMPSVPPSASGAPPIPKKRPEAPAHASIKPLAAEPAAPTTPSIDDAAKKLPGGIAPKAPF